MKKLLFPIFFALIAFSCGSVRISSDFDRKAQFASYKTYGFTQEALNIPVDEINRSRLIKAVENELGLKGFTKSEKPDVFVDLKLTTQLKQTATASTNYGSGYGYRWGGGFSTTSIDIDQYTEGTLFIDIIDATKKQLVWQGRGIRTLNPDASSEKREENINNAVRLIFTKYPPTIRQ